MEIILSILIPCMPVHLTELAELRKILDPQLTGEVEVITDHSMNYNIGVKRNKLLALASGKYIVMIDADDKISTDYVAKILDACKSDCDCIGISGVITTDGRNEMQWHISKDYQDWFERNKVYYRTPNHISPVKRELALKAGFPEISFGEDYHYSMNLLPFLKTEIKVSGNIYHYKFISKK